MEKMLISINMATPCLPAAGRRDGLSSPFLERGTGRDVVHHYTFWMAREQGMGCCRADTGCLGGLPGMRTSCLPSVGVTVMLVTGDQHPWDNVWLWASTSIASLVASARLPSEDTSFEEVCWDFLLRFWEGRKADWSADTCWEHRGCKASKMSFKDSQSSLNSFEALYRRWQRKTSGKLEVKQPVLVYSQLCSLCWPSRGSRYWLLSI